MPECSGKSDCLCLSCVAEGLRLSEEATKGPWQQNGSHIYGPDPARLLVCQMHYIGRGYQDESAANESLIKHSRDRYPALLAEREAALKRIAELEKAVEDAPHDFDCESMAARLASPQPGETDVPGEPINRSAL